ncbi:MAG: efflux RND transporter permease subunit [Lentisphaeria bacterium]|nr:efflux RND transporter permease subunit [Lentisphaeria bacterium]
MFSKIFIERPRLAFVVSIIMVLCGIITVRKLPVAEYPEIAPPNIMCITSFAGASSTEVQDTVAMPLESQFNGLEDIIYFSSNCSNNGEYFCTMTFKSGINDDIAMVNVQNAIKTAEPMLPNEVRAVGVMTRKRSSDILCAFSYATDGSVWTTPQMNNYVSTKIVDTLSRVEGVASVEAMGASVYSMRIWMDPLRMAAMGISTSEIAAAVSNQNIQAAAGTIGSENSSHYMEYKLNVKGRLKTAEEFSNIIVRTDDDGNILRLKDIATVELGAKSYAAEARWNGEENVMVAIYRNNDSNALATVKAVKAAVDEIEKNLPKGVKSTLAFDPTRFIEISMKEIVETLLLALLMVVLITYLFLQDWRATLVPTIAIPVSLMGTFTFMAALGLSINTLTMFGLVLVIGSLVDDAIVVVENTQTLMAKEKLNSHDAAIKTMQQITSAIIATTLVTVACYAPLAFYGGMVGRIYLQFAATMCISLCLSTVCAMTLSPALCSLIMRPPREKPLAIFAPFNWFLDLTRKIYLSCVRFFVHQGILTLLILSGIIFCLYYISKQVPGSFLPTEDKGALFCNVELARGATLNRTSDALEQFRVKAAEIPGIKDIMCIAGFSLLSGQGESCALCLVMLDDWDLRDTRKNPELSLDAIKNKLQMTANEIPAIQCMVFTPPAIQGLGATGGVTFNICNDGTASPTEIAAVAQKFAGELSARPEAAYAMTTFSADTTQISLQIDREKAETLGLTAGMIFSALQSHLASYYINDFNLEGETFNVKMQASREHRVTLDDIRDLQIRNNYGEMVPLSAIGSLVFEVGPRRIERFNKLTSAQIQAQAAKGATSGELMRIIEEEIELPQGYSIGWTDMSYQERQNQGQIFSLMVIAMLFAYLFLVAQYESWTIPVPVMLTVFTALLGASIGLKLTSEPLSIYAQLGLVMLIGLTAKNAILMVEFSKDEREKGVDVFTAAENGASLRYRAVLMTAWSFVFGVFPLVVATGAGAGSRRAIGITTFSGMLLATTLGLIMTPALYAVFQRLRETGKRLLHGKK